ncbi:MAG: methyl-coenzyme M reductase operon protein D [Candidatus Hadarchaeales archaeon]
METGKPEVEVFPYRLPSDETVSKFLNLLRGIKGVSRVMMHGPSIYYRRFIEVGGKKIVLRIQVGKFWVEMETLEELETLKEVCRQVFPYGFELKVGRFTREKEPLSGRRLVLRMDTCFLEGGEEE